jgi:tetratricopeptide (TPR) repeat protein
MNDFQQAGENFARALDIDPDNHVLLTKMGVLFGRAGDTQTAFDYFRWSMEINPDYAAGYLNWGNVLLVNGDTTEAIVKYNTAKNLEQTLIEPYYNLTVLYIRLGNLSMARRNVDSLLLIDPGNSRGLSLKQRLGN